MDRRTAMIALASLVASRGGWAAGRARRIVALLPRGSCEEAHTKIHPRMRAEMARVGQVDVAFESHCFGDDFARAEGLARDAIRSGADVIAVEGTPAARLVSRLTSTIPIMAVLGDPVASGFVRDLGRPEGNMTGFTNSRPETPQKIVELARLAVPGLSRLVLAARAGYPEAPRQLARYADAAQAAAVDADVQLVEPGELAGFFARARAGEVVHLRWGDEDSRPVAALALERRVPVILDNRGFVEHGGLMSYSLHHRNSARSQAVLLDKLLRGIAPAAIPWELPDRPHLAVNLRAAKVLSLQPLRELELRADQVIR